LKLASRASNSLPARFSAAVWFSRIFFYAFLGGLSPGWPSPAANGAESGAGSFRFREVAAELGISGPRNLAGRPGKDHLLDSSGAGAALLDYDRDGRLDLYIANGWRIEGERIAERGRNALWHQRPDGLFEDVTARAGVDGAGRWGCGVAAADFDGDGWTDIFVTNFGPNLFYRNKGDGTFDEVARKVGLEAPAWNTGAAFFDADADGDLDVYIAAYIDCTLDEVLKAKRTLDWKGKEKVALGPFGLKGARDRFFRQEGGRFVDATAAAGFEDRALAFGFTARAADYDQDGDLDVFVANDSDANYYFRNEGGGRFVEAGLLAGCALNANGAAQANMGVAVGDVTGDGFTDLLVTTFSEDSVVLYRGVAGGFFEEATSDWGLRVPTYLPMDWGCVLADFDADGDLDLAIANGHIYPQVDAHPDAGQTYAQPLLLLENLGRSYVDASAAAGPALAARRVHRALIAGDVDNDGDVDLVGTALDENPFILRNEGPQGSWLIVVLADAGGPVSRVGTRVNVTAGARILSRDVAAGDSFLSTNDPRLHFGLGTAEKADRVEIFWPNGVRSVIEDVPTRQVLRVKSPPGRETPGR